MSQQSKIDDLERLPNSEEDTPIEILPNGEIRAIGRATATDIEILPNGEIRAIGRATATDMGSKKPLTMKENLAGKY